MLKIGYAGTLNSYKNLSNANRSKDFFLKKWFWTYSVNNINSETRSEKYLFDSIETLKSKYPLYYKSLQLWLWGMIDSNIQKQAINRGISDIVRIDGYVSKKETDKRLDDCDVLFLPLETSMGEQKPLFIPGKLYDYLQIGKPIFALGEPSDATDILEKSGLGIICSPFETTKIVENLKYLIDNQQTLSKQYSPNEEYISKFYFSKLTGKLAGILDEL